MSIQGSINSLLGVVAAGGVLYNKSEYKQNKDYDKTLDKMNKELQNTNDPAIKKLYAEKAQQMTSNKFQRTGSLEDANNLATLNDIVSGYNGEAPQVVDTTKMDMSSFTNVPLNPGMANMQQHGTEKLTQKMDWRKRRRLARRQHRLQSDARIKGGK